jgi:hypothetical protein
LKRALHEHAVWHEDVLPCNERCLDDLAARLSKIEGAEEPPKTV